MIIMSSEVHWRYCWDVACKGSFNLQGPSFSFENEELQQRILEVPFNSTLSIFSLTLRPLIFHILSPEPGTVAASRHQ